MRLSFTFRVSSSNPALVDAFVAPMGPYICCSSRSCCKVGKLKPSSPAALRPGFASRRGSSESLSGFRARSYALQPPYPRSRLAAGSPVSGYLRFGSSAGRGPYARRPRRGRLQRRSGRRARLRRASPRAPPNPLRRRRSKPRRRRRLGPPLRRGRSAGRPLPRPHRERAAPEGTRSRPRVSRAGGRRRARGGASRPRQAPMPR